MAALMPPPQFQPQPPKRYWEGGIYNASYQGHHKELHNILNQRGLDVDWAQPGSGITAARAAAENGHDECLSQLISHAADVAKAAKDGWAPIHIACQFGRYACIEVLADSLADVNMERTADEYGTTPAMICCKNGHVKCLALLSDKGADLDQSSHRGQTAAHVACQTGQLKCLQLLGKRGASLSTRDSDGHTPLDYGRMSKQRDCVDYLLTNKATGADVEDLPTATEALKVRTTEPFCVFFTGLVL
jgi:ankyrin repeat protein